jgi:hypothetical protein
MLVFGVILASACGGGGSGGSSSPGLSQFSLQLGNENVLLTNSQRVSMGFQYGPPDGTLGVVRSNGNYTFFAAAGASSGCAGTPLIQGTYRFGGTLNQLDASLGCTAVVQPGTDPNGYSFDRDYAGGGPTIPITGPSAQSGLLHIYHGEWHGGTCGSGSCFYASLGMAISTDGGASFTKLGEIIQPTVARAPVVASSKNIDLGGGTLVIADDNGQHIADLTTFDPNRVYLYVFYSDTDFTNTIHPCEVALCIGVARAKLTDVTTAAFALDTAMFPHLFHKYYQGAFTEPATSLDPDAAVASGHYTPVVFDVGLFASVIYDSYIGQYLIAYTTGNSQVVMRSGADLFHWSTPITSAGVSEAGNHILYATLVGEGNDPMTGANAPYLFYIKATAWPNWSVATVVNRTMQLTILH